MTSMKLTRALHTLKAFEPLCDARRHRENGRVGAPRGISREDLLNPAVLVPQILHMWVHGRQLHRLAVAAQRVRQALPRTVASRFDVGSGRVDTVATIPKHERSKIGAPPLPLVSRRGRSDRRVAGGRSGGADESGAAAGSPTLAGGVQILEYVVVMDGLGHAPVPLEDALDLHLDGRRARRVSRL